MGKQNMHSDNHDKNGKKKPKGKYCVAGLPGDLSCKNNSKTGGLISTHKFPRNDYYHEKWIRFVQRHRVGWKPSNHLLFVLHILSRLALSNGLISTLEGETFKRNGSYEKTQYPRKIAGRILQNQPRRQSMSEER